MFQQLLVSQQRSRFSKVQFHSCPSNSDDAEDDSFSNDEKKVETKQKRPEALKLSIVLNKSLTSCLGWLI